MTTNTTNTTDSGTLKNINSISNSKSDEQTNLKKTVSPKDPFKKNRWTFGLGTTGRDMVYSLVSMYLIFYLTDILKMSNAIIINVTTVMLCARIFDALNDPIMGSFVDSTHTRWGKFKPWIIFGGLLSGILTIMLFTDFGMTGFSYIVLFAVIYVLWGMAWTTNDIAYWSMLPSLSYEQSEREKIGSIARICANIGLFFVVAGFQPITSAISNSLGGNDVKAWNIYALCLVVIMWIFQLFTLIGTKEPCLQEDATSKERTTLKGMLTALFKNDQLVAVAVSLSLFSIGYFTTTSFGVYFFKYAYKNESMYSIFAIILGVSQILALSVFPLISKKLDRKRLYIMATVMVSVGYIIFFLSPMNMIPIGIAGVLIFFAQACIQLLMLMFLADTVEYGEWKLGKRNESVTFSLQPFINKLAGAISSGIVGYVVVLSGINEAITPSDVTAAGLLQMKVAMLLFPVFVIALGFVIYLKFYRLDKKTYENILTKLEKRKNDE